MTTFFVLSALLTVLPLAWAWQKVTVPVRDWFLDRDFEVAKMRTRREHGAQALADELDAYREERQYKGMPSSWLYGAGYKISPKGTLVKIPPWGLSLSD